MLHEFADVPPLFTALGLDGQVYRLVGFEPHERADFVTITLLVWESHCATCGDLFRTRSPLSVRSLGRRCEEHRAPGRAVGRRGEHAVWVKPPERAGA